MIVLIVVALALIGILVALWFYGNKLQKRQAEAEEQMQAVAQTVSMLVIDKKRMKLTEAGLPQIVIDQTPKMLRRSKVPVVKAKIGPKITTFICDAKVFDIIPVKTEVKVVLSGLYITAVKSARGGLEKPPEKKGFFKRIFSKKESK
jgi:type II secretory pathway pseudopilin PulG